MLAVQPPRTASADLITVFQERCWARARLFAEGELELHEAVDELQNNAMGNGLVAAIGQDRVQWLMSDAFGAVRSSRALHGIPCLPTAWDAEYEVDWDREAIERRISGHLSASTIDAFKHMLRQNDPDRLRKWLGRRTLPERRAMRDLLVVK
jgi:hypothetical protein